MSISPAVEAEAKTLGLSSRFVSSLYRCRVEAAVERRRVGCARSGRLVSVDPGIHPYVPAARTDNGAATLVVGRSPAGLRICGVATHRAEPRAATMIVSILPSHLSCTVRCRPPSDPALWRAYYIAGFTDYVGRTGHPSSDSTPGCLGSACSPAGDGGPSHASEHAVVPAVAPSYLRFAICSRSRLGQHRPAHRPGPLGGAGRVPGR